MAYEATVFSVLIASPGDTASARDAVEATIMSWNRDRSAVQRVMLRALRWETDAVPGMGGDGQQEINHQLVDEADVVVALFHSRLGLPTARSVSGTAEEIERAIERGIPVHIYFSEMPLPHDVDPIGLSELNAFKTALQARGLLGSFASLEELCSRLRTALERDVPELEAGWRGAAEGKHAVMRARYEYDREPEVLASGQIMLRTVRERLLLENIGDADAVEVEVRVVSAGGGSAPIVGGIFPIPTIAPGSGVTVPVTVHLGVSPIWDVTIEWTEQGIPRNQVVRVSTI